MQVPENPQLDIVISRSLKTPQLDIKISNVSCLSGVMFHISDTENQDIQPILEILPTITKPQSQNTLRLNKANPAQWTIKA